jgi:dinuclear metal center YbgI/SA1388 family protein
MELQRMVSYMWNGLQVEGKKEVRSVAFAVDAGISTFQKAIESNADMIFVHHGHYFKGIDPLMVGWQKERIQLLLKHEISLYAAHLPLDAHPEVGNNAQLFTLLGAEKKAPFDFVKEISISWIAEFKNPVELSKIENTLNDSLTTRCTVLDFGGNQIRTVAISSGGAGYKVFNQALKAKVDLYITGDAIEIYQTAKDAKLNVIFAGHHATEKLGIKALQKHLITKFSLDTHFIDMPTGL